jgi:hypothetical protein
LLREYFPKGTDITGDIRYLNAVADEINDRPVLYSDSGRQQKCSQSFSSMTIPGTTSAQLLPPVETSTMFLFRGAYAVLRNPSGHREVSFDDVTEASEAVMTASLLMRMLDRVERRLQAIM